MIYPPYRIWYHAILLFPSLAYSIILSGGPNCRTDGTPVEYARPDDIISITCFVDSPDGGLNLLTWRIPSFGVLVSNVGGADSDDTNQPEFTSVVNDFNDPLAITNATLSFPAVKDLDGAVVRCQDNNNPIEERNCTLFILSKDYLVTVCILKSLWPNLMYCFKVFSFISVV